MKDFEMVKDLQKRYASGKNIEFEFFWKGPFSQWDRTGFTVAGVYYNTAEHWMMAQKAIIFNDSEALERIIKAKHPKEAKDLGRKVKGFNEGVWNKYRYASVLSGNKYKFTQNKEYHDILMATGDKVLVEASPVDTIWGIGLAEEDNNANNPLKWKGLNLLGFVLTDLREQLK